MMKLLAIIAIGAALLATAALAQFPPGVGPNVPSSPSGNGGTPGGSNGQLQINNSGSFGGITLGGDCTFASPNITCTRLNGSNFVNAMAATSATGNFGGL